MQNRDDDRPPSSPRRPDLELRTLGHAERVLPAHESKLGRDLADAWGGPPGRHAAIGRARFWTPLRVVMLVAVAFLALGFGTKAACLQVSDPAGDGEPALAWDGRQYYMACYNDIVPLYSATGLDTGALPYAHMWLDADGQERYMEYPVLTGMFQFGAAQVAQAWEAISPGSPLEVVKYFALAVLGLSALWLLAVWATYLSAGRRPWDTMFMAASPIVVFQVFTNFDAIAIAATAVALLLWSRNRSVLAGVAIGVGVAAKLYPLFLFGPLLVLALRNRRFAGFFRALGAAVVTWLVINLPFIITVPDGWREFYRLNTDRPVNPESIYNVIAGLTGWGGFDQALAAGEAPTVVNTVSLVLFLAACLGVLVLGMTAPRSPRVAQLAFLVVAAFLLTNKVWSPQFSLWLVPLALLAIPSVRVLLPWMVFDAFLWIAHMSHFWGPENLGLNAEWFYALVLIRNLLVVGVCAVIIRHMFRPGLDPVRGAHGGRDPLAGDVAPRLVAGAGAGAVASAAAGAPSPRRAGDTGGRVGDTVRNNRFGDGRE